MPEVSVIIPAYNTEKYIVETIKSVQNQTFADFELIIVDDGSTDRTLELIQAEAARDCRIRIIPQQNRGVAAARNAGMQQASGNFISFLDADDLWDKEFLRKMLKKQEETGASLVICGHSAMIEGKLEPYKGNYCTGSVLYNYIVNELYLKKYRQIALDANIDSYLIDRSLIKKYGISFTAGCQYGEDIEFEYKVMSVATAAMVEESLTVYRKHAGSLTRQIWKFDHALMMIKSRERALDFVKEHCAQHNREEILSMLQLEIDHLRAKALWRCLKYKQYELLNEKLAADWSASLTRIRNSPDVNFSRRLRSAILLSGRGMLRNFFKA